MFPYDLSLVSWKLICLYLHWPTSHQPGISWNGLGQLEGDMGRNNITPRNNSKKKRVPNIVTSLFFLMLPPGQAGTRNPCMHRRVYLQLTTSCWQSNFLHTMKIMLKRFGYEEWTCWIKLIDCYFEVANKCLGLRYTRLFSFRLGLLNMKRKHFVNRML